MTKSEAKYYRDNYDIVEESRSPIIDGDRQIHYRLTKRKGTSKEYIVWIRMEVQDVGRVLIKSVQFATSEHLALEKALTKYISKADWRTHRFGKDHEITVKQTR